MSGVCAPAGRASKAKNANSDAKTTAKAVTPAIGFVRVDVFTDTPPVFVWRPQGKSKLL
jgi:hypothetical protein